MNTSALPSVSHWTRWLNFGIGIAAATLNFSLSVSDNQLSHLLAGLGFTLLAVVWFHYPLAGLGRSTQRPTQASLHRSSAPSMNRGFVSITVTGLTLIILSLIIRWAS